MTFKLRGYQREAIDHVVSRWVAGDVRVPIVLATGLGKTQIFTTLADEWLSNNPGRRVLIIAHTDELIGQAAKRMRQVAPARRIGIVKAQQNEVLAEIVVSSRQTLASAKRRGQLNRVGLIIIDECHHAIKTNTYGKILDHFGAFDVEEKAGSHVHVLGVTATLHRGDKEKLSTVWQQPDKGGIFTRDILFGIRHGYLLDVRGERVTVPDLDLSRVRVSGGDYRESDLGEELERTFAPEVIAQEYDRLACHPDAGLPGGPKYRRGIAFWPLVDTARHGAKAFNEAGIRSDMVCGETPKHERREILQRFHLPLEHDEALDVVHNAMVLTEGFDEPSADVVVIARPTKNPGLYQQMVGRVLRPNLELPPEQRDKALILDVRGASGEALSLRALIDLSPERAKRAEGADEGLSLLELDEYLEQVEEELEDQRAGAAYEFEGAEDYRGPATSETFDPLGRDKVWGRTPAGHLFVSAGTVGYVFLAPSVEGEPGTYDVVTASKAHYVGRDGVVPWVKGPQAYGIEPGLDLEMALSWGEDIAERVGGPGTITLLGRKSRWRKGAPSEAQMKLAHARKIPGVYRQTHRDEILGEIVTFKTEMSKGELSEALDAAQAAIRIDPIVASVQALVAMRRESDKQKASM